MELTNAMLQWLSAGQTADRRFPGEVAQDDSLDAFDLILTDPAMRT
jgi:hypothetical protein